MTENFWAGPMGVETATNRRSNTVTYSELPIDGIESMPGSGPVG
jgi:hypothetical protein